MNRAMNSTPGGAVIHRWPSSDNPPADMRGYRLHVGGSSVWPRGCHAEQGNCASYFFQAQIQESTMRVVVSVRGTNRRDKRVSAVVLLLRPMPRVR